MARACHVVGVGLVSAGGKDLASTWKTLVHGRTVCGSMPARFRSKVRPTQAAAVIDLMPGPDRLECMAGLAIDEALRKVPAELVIDALVVGSSSASFAEVELGNDTSPRYLAASLAAREGIRTKFQLSQACASSGTAIALGALMIRQGVADVVLAGGADELTACVVAAFDGARIYSDQCRPFDGERDGLVLGEAAAFVLLARPDLLEPLCVVSGLGMACDAEDSIAPSVEGITRTIRVALEDAGDPDVDFVIAHGTGTKVNDVVEALAIREAVRRDKRVMPIVSSFKGSLGHPQGASGAVSVALGVKALQEQMAFPTVGFRVKDPEVKVPVVSTPVPLRLENVLCLSSGTWGTNAAIVLEKRRI